MMAAVKAGETLTVSLTANYGTIIVLVRIPGAPDVPDTDPAAAVTVTSNSTSPGRHAKCELP
jgi:hypothetical protein